MSTHVTPSSPKRKGTKHNPTKWDDEKTATLLEIFEIEINAGNRPGGVFSKQGWRNVVSKFNSQTGLNLNKDQLKNKQDNLRREYTKWESLIGKEIGLGWDQDKRTLSAPDEWWAEKAKVDPTILRYKDAGPIHLDLMQIIFSGVTTTGYKSYIPVDPLRSIVEENEIEGNAIPLTQTSNDSFQEVLETPIDAYNDNEGIGVGDVGASTNKLGARKRKWQSSSVKISHTDKICDTIETISQTMRLNMEAIQSRRKVDESCLCNNCETEKLIDMQLDGHLVCGMQAVLALDHVSKYCLKQPMRDSSLSGSKWVWELWHGHDKRFFENMRMRKPVLRQLISDLIHYGRMSDQPKGVSLEESFVIFLQIVGQGVTYPVVAERVQRSSETISNHFHMVLDTVCNLGYFVVRPTDPKFEIVPNEIAGNPLYYPYFTNCIGAIDGTHISLRISEDMKLRWMNRKGMCTTNVLAIVDFSMRIIFANVGMEGSMHDSRVLTESQRDTRRNFPTPPEGKYYMADAGYPLMKGFLTPYRNVRCHKSNWRGNPVQTNSNEVFNYRHSSLRIVVERTFGVLKKRWRVLNNMSYVKLDDQIKIIWACICLHNYIRMHDAGDLHELGAIPPIDENLSSRLRSHENAQWMRVDRSEYTEMEQFRNHIRDSIM